jgi:amidophosphoribosyltransferase
MRPACPPLLFSCKYLNFSQSRSELELASRRAIRKLNGEDVEDIYKYADPNSKDYEKMVNLIRKELGLDTLKYQKLDDLIKAIGLPKSKLCTYCWDGK